MNQFRKSTPIVPSSTNIETVTDIGKVSGSSNSPITIEEDDNDPLTETQRLKLRTEIVNSTIVLDDERYMTAAPSTLEDMKMEGLDQTNMYVRTGEGGEVKREPITISDSDDEVDERNCRSYKGTKRTRFGI